MMLVVARKEGEAVRIGEDTWVYIVGLTGTTVRLGFEAPADTPVLREELIDDDAVRHPGKVRTLLPNDDGAA
jgi:carbon storage regulator